MNKPQRGLWEVQATTAPRLECDKIGITTLELGDGELIAFREHLEDKTKFCVIVNSDWTKVNTKAEFLMKAFLAPLELEYKRSFVITTGVAYLIGAKDMDKEISEA